MGDVIGCYYWNDSSMHSIQTDDPLEELYRKLITQMSAKYPGIHWGHLESCGVNAMTNCLAATRHGREIIIRLCQTLGAYRHQFPHLLIGYLNDPANYDKMRAIRSNLDPRLVQGNRVPQYYELVARDVCGIAAHFEWGCTFDKVRNYNVRGFPVQICLKSPGHYITSKAVNTLKGVLLSDDSWPARTGGTGFNNEINPADFSNIENWLVWYEIT